MLCINSSISSGRIAIPESAPSRSGRHRNSVRNRCLIDTTPSRRTLTAAARACALQPRLALVNEFGFLLDYFRGSARAVPAGQSPAGMKGSGTDVARIAVLPKQSRQSRRRKRAEQGWPRIARQKRESSRLTARPRDRKTRSAFARRSSTSVELFPWYTESDGRWVLLIPSSAATSP
jgi:hypothetical protein